MARQLKMLHVYRYAIRYAGTCPETVGELETLVFHM